MWFSRMPIDKKCYILGLVGGAFAGLVLGIVISSLRIPKNEYWSAIDSPLMAAVIGGFATAALTAIVTFIVTDYFNNKPQIDSIEYKINALRMIYFRAQKFISEIRNIEFPSDDLERKLIFMHIEAINDIINATAFKKSSENLPLFIYQNCVAFEKLTERFTLGLEEGRLFAFISVEGPPYTPNDLFIEKENIVDQMKQLIDKTKRVTENKYRIFYEEILIE